ncbi:MAG: GHMP kinase [Candidatus Aminicenantes bacterium]|nr:GHMP kinase [Candidatus Aminicenantes bacterium]
MIRGGAFARAGLLGNPSDNYHGKVLAVAVRNFRAEVTLRESPRLVFVPPAEEGPGYGSFEDFVSRTKLYGYYGGTRLVQAAAKTFFEWCLDNGVRLPVRNFALTYETDIPRQVGLGGSSALVTAAFRALTSFYGIAIPVERLPSLILKSEKEELDINAGYMDRVVQVYEGLVYMDLDEALFRERGYGRYESLDPALLPSLYLAYKPSLGKVSGRVLSEMYVRHRDGDPVVREGIRKIGSLAEKGREALLAGDRRTFARLMNENFDLRRSLLTINPANLEMIETARSCGASAKFAGSGGSIVGAYAGEEMFRRLEAALGRLGAVVLKPKVQ